MSWKSGMRAIDKLERHTVIAGTLKQELLKWQYVVFGSECVKMSVKYFHFFFLIQLVVMWLPFYSY